MKKKEIRVKFKHKLNWLYGVEITQMIKDLKGLQEEGATHVDLEVYEGYGEAYLDIEPYARRLETNEEFDYRVKCERDLEQRAIERELRTLESLKKKYE